MDDYVFLIDGAVGPSAPHLSPRGHACTASGITVLAMPPGRVDLKLTFDQIGLNVLPYGADRMSRWKYCGEDRLAFAGQGPRHTLHVGGDLELVCENPNWECLVEIDPSALPGLAAEALDGVGPELGRFDTGHDPEIALLADLSIRHLRFGKPDPLYAQGLAIAMIARSLTPPDRAIPTAGTTPRITRAIDYIEEHLEEDLSVAAIASAAAMSPSWLQSAFKATTGQPVFAYVRERRLERARLLLADSRLPLAQIAFACGFSSHSHMTRLFTARYGASPREMR